MRRTNERLLMMGKEEKASLWLQAREAQHQRGNSNKLPPMSGCWLQATPEKQQQQPTTNERLLAASALPVAATPERQQPTANERLLAARARAPHEAERH